MKKNFDTLVSEERRLIIVASDAKYRELTEQIDSKKLMLLLGTAVVAPWLLPPFLIAGPVALLGSSYLVPTLAGSGILGRRDFASFLRVGEIPFPHLSPVEAADRFGFDHGHPQDGTAYVLDATRSTYYLVPAIANERLAQEKVAAFHELAGSLGAKKVELESGELVEKRARGRASIPLQEVAAQVGIDASFGARNEVQRSVYAEFGEPPQPPHVPEHLERWLNVDPMLRSLVQNRLNSAILRCGISLTLGNTIDIDAKVVAALAGSFKVGVGGSYKRVARSVWKFSIEFWPRA